ncbi:hypothetical protein KY494_20175 [Janthinobacterium sp. PAMC25594]|nr:hypothetical protein KY494_20175 [Janthinobacterium sp. PAMC25594]
MPTLLELLDALESKVNKDSHKSSKRPSSDGPIKKTRSLREPSGKIAGGQTEHKGTLLRQIERPAQVIQHRLPSVRSLLPSSAPWRCLVAERCNVFEVPMASCQAIEHRTWTLHRAEQRIPAHFWPTWPRRCNTARVKTSLLRDGLIT